MSWEKQIKLCVSSQRGELFKLSTFSFKSLMLKLTKKIRTMICNFWNTVKIQLLCTCCLWLYVHAWIHPWTKLIVSFMVSFLILLRSLRVYIVNQLFLSGSINIKTFSPLAFVHLSSIISVNQLIIDNYSPKAKLMLLNNPRDENYSNSFALYYGYLYTEFPRWRRLGLFPLFTLWVQHLLFVFKRTSSGIWLCFMFKYIPSICWS